MTRVVISYDYYLLAVFYVSFIVTPLCSNASELVSSLMFAAKKTKTSSSLTFSQVKLIIAFYCQLTAMS